MKLKELMKRIADKKIEKKGIRNNFKVEVQKARTIAELKMIILKLIDLISSDDE